MLTDIAGIGPVKADELHKRGIRTRADLLRIKKELPQITQDYLRYNPVKPIPRKTISELEILLKQLRMRTFIGGGYSRGNPTSKDIDVMISRPALMRREGPTLLAKLNNAIATIPWLKFRVPYMSGDNKISGMLQYKRKYYKIDFFITPPDEWLFAKTYIIGSGQFNIRMRAQAKRLGYLLNHKGLFNRKTGNKIPINNERELFAKLGMTYRTPKNRK